MEKNENIIVKCDYCGVLNDLKNGTCKYCGAVLHYDNNENNSKVPTEADLKKGAEMLKTIEGAVVITFKDGKRDIAFIEKAESTYISLLSGIKYYDLKKIWKWEYGAPEGYEGFYISKKELINEFMTAEEIEKKLDRLDTLSFLPLAGTGLAMLALTLCVLEIMGD